MKFWKMTLFTSLSLASLFLFLVVHILTVSKEDREGYRKLMEVSNSTTTLKSATSYSAKQLKEGTKKTLLIGQGEGRKIGKLSCASSVLCYEKENRKSVLKEEMEALDLLFQEELLPDSQIVVHLKSDQAIYYYDQEKLEAKNVHIFRYKLPSHHFPEKLTTPFFTGTADFITVAFKGQPSLSAKNLKGMTQ